VKFGRIQNLGNATQNRLLGSAMRGQQLAGPTRITAIEDDIGEGPADIGRQTSIMVTREHSHSVPCQVAE
jgi:hypothetical protein